MYAGMSSLVEHGVMRHTAEGYRLTPKGRALMPVLVTLMQWGDAWQRDDPPPTYFVDDSTGAAIEPVLVDRTTATPLTELRVRAVGPVTDGIR